MKKTYDELIEGLRGLSRRGYVRTRRSGNTGIGKTIEDLLGIDENNFAGPNGHETELKSARKEGNSMLTLFTKSPCPRGINGQLVRRFGRTRPNGKKSLHTTIDGLGYNRLYGQEGFKIEVLDSRVEIRHNRYGNMSTPYWQQETLREVLEKKYVRNLLYVKADCRGSGWGEEFHYNEAWLMRGLEFDRFIDAINGGKVLVDIRVGQYKDGRPHDHGTGFRMFAEDLKYCFADIERVI